MSTTFFYCHRHDCEKLKSMCENLGASLRSYVGHRSYVDSKQLFMILDCKMLVQYYCTSCNSKLSRLVDFLACILQYGVESVFPSCFADNADHGSIYCKLRETDPFILPSLMNQDRLCDLRSLDKYRRGETEKADFKEITDEFASIKTRVY